MAISAATVVGSYVVPSGSAYQGSVTVPAGGIATGQTIVVYTVSTNSAVTSVTDSAGNTYVNDASLIVPGNNLLMTLYRASNCFGLVSGQTINVSIPVASTSPNFGFAVETYANLAPVQAFDVAVAAGASSGTALSSGATGTPSGIEELVLGFGAWSAVSGSTLTITPGTGYTLNQTAQPATGLFGLFSESKIVNPATAAQSSTATLSRTGYWGQICILYKAAVGTGGSGGIVGGPLATGVFGPIIPTVGSSGVLHPHHTRTT